jgi:hypothetical protein
MNRRVRTLLGGMSTASLIMAGTLPALGQYGEPPPSCPTRSKTKQVEKSKDKAKDNAAAKSKADKAAAEKAAKTAAQTKAKSSK